MSDNGYPYSLRWHKVHHQDILNLFNYLYNLSWNPEVQKSEEFIRDYTFRLKMHVNSKAAENCEVF